MTRATVTQLRAPRAATRLGPKEARTFVQRARAAGLVTSPAARALFEHLLRVCDPRQGFTQAIPQRDQVNPATGDVTMFGLAKELGVHTDTLWRANRALAASGLVRVESGRGRTWTRYTLNAARILAVLGELPGSPWGTTPVHPGENPISETPQNAGSDPAECGDSPRELRAQTPQNPDSNARARVYARESDPSKTNSPLPRQSAAGPRADDSPPASGQGPLSDFERCEHGRTPAQGGCRACGTTRRQLADRQAAEQRDAEHRARVAEQLRQREEAAAAKAAKPAPDPEVIKAARAAARAGKRAPK